MKKLGFGILLLITSLSAQAFTEACQLVAQMAGPDYQAKPKRFGSLTAPEDMPKSVEASFIERNGGWFIYQPQKTGLMWTIAALKCKRWARRLMSLCRCC